MSHSNRAGLLRPAILATSITMALCSQAMAEQATFHSESFRANSPKLIFTPQTAITSDMNEDLAKSYLANNFKRFGLTSAKNVRLVNSRESLLGTHYYFQQYLGDVKVDTAEVIVTIDKSGTEVSKVFNNAYKTTPRQELSVKMGKPQRHECFQGD